MSGLADAFHEALRTNPVCPVCGVEVDERRVMLTMGLCHDCSRGVKVSTQTGNQRLHPMRRKFRRRKRLRQRILERDDYTCQNCGLRGDPDNAGELLSVDHILSILRGGTNDESNLRVLCKDCNHAREANPQRFARKTALP